MRGDTEVTFFGDFSDAVADEPRYAAQLFEIRRRADRSGEAALYLEGDKINGEDYLFSGWRLESRYRLFEYGAFLNPVLYIEYENLDPNHKYLLEVTGRTDTPEGPETWKHEIESKLIVGHDITKKFDVAFNWINETNVDTGRWEFGYVFGFNYAIVGEANQEAKEHEHGGHEHSSNIAGWAIKEVKLGGEIYGGLGDSTLGLTVDPNVTQQYAGLNLKTEWGKRPACHGGRCGGLDEGE